MFLASASSPLILHLREDAPQLREETEMVAAMTERPVKCTENVSSLLIIIKHEHTSLG